MTSLSVLGNARSSHLLAVKLCSEKQANPQCYNHVTVSIPAMSIPSGNVTQKFWRPCWPQDPTSLKSLAHRQATAWCAVRSHQWTGTHPNTKQATTAELPATSQTNVSGFHFIPTRQSVLRGWHFPWIWFTNVCPLCARYSVDTQYLCCVN